MHWPHRSAVFGVQIRTLTPSDQKNSGLSQSLVEDAPPQAQSHVNVTRQSRSPKADAQLFTFFLLVTISCCSSSLYLRQLQAVAGARVLAAEPSERESVMGPQRTGASPEILASDADGSAQPVCSRRGHVSGGDGRPGSLNR